MTVYETLTAGGCIRGDTSSCCYRHEEKKVSIFHHGDDFAIVARRADTLWATSLIAKTFIVKDQGCLGPRATDVKEMKFLNRTIAYFGGGYQRWGAHWDHA